MTRTILFSVLFNLVATVDMAQEPAAPVESAASRPATETKVFTLQHAQATEVAEVLRQVYDRGPSKIVPDARTNSVIVTGPDAQLQEIEALLLKLDEAGSAPASSVRRVRTYRVKNGDTLNAIASKELGHSRFSKDIFDANRHLLKTPDSLQTGMELVIPIPTDPLKAEAAKLVVQLQDERTKLLQTLGPDHPKVKELNARIDTARKSPENTTFKDNASVSPEDAAAWASMLNEIIQELQKERDTFAKENPSHPRVADLDALIDQLKADNAEVFATAAHEQAHTIAGLKEAVSMMPASLANARAERDRLVKDDPTNPRIRELDQTMAIVIVMERNYAKAIAAAESGVDSRSPEFVPLNGEVREASSKELQQQVAQLRKDYEAADAQAHHLAEQLKQSPVEAKQVELRKAVQRAFTARQSLLRAELLEMQTRLLQTQRSIDLRERISDQIIQRRVEDLLHPQLKWEGETAPGQPLSQSTTPTAAKTRIHVPIDPKAALLAQLQGVWEVEVQSDDLPKVQKPMFRVIAEIRDNVMTWSLDPPQPENDKPPVFLIKLGEPGTPQPVDLVMNPNDGPDRLEMPGIIEISDDLIRICTSESQQRPEVFSVGENTDIYVLSQRAAAPAVTELEGDWHVVSAKDADGKSRDTSPANATFRGDRYTLVYAGGEVSRRVEIDSSQKVIRYYQVGEDSFTRDTYVLEGEQLILRSSPPDVTVLQRGHIRIPKVVPPATKDQETRWRSAIVEILVSGKPDAIQNGGQKIGFGVIVAADGTLISHMGGGWSNTMKDWPNIDARFDDGSLVPLQIVESGGSGFVVLRPKQGVHLNHYFPLSEVTTGIGEEVYVGQMALTALEGGLYQMAATAVTLTQTDRRVATFGDPVWQLTSPERIPNSFCFPVLSKDGELLAITMADTGGLLLAMPVGQLKEAFPKLLGQEAAQQADTPPVPPAVPAEAPAETVPVNP